VTPRGVQLLRTPRDASFGDDHPRTLISAKNLAHVLSALGRYQAARELAEDTLARRRRVLGDDHLSILASADSLARVLAALGEHQACVSLHEDTLLPNPWCSRLHDGS